MKDALIGIIGGSGLGEALGAIGLGEAVQVDTPFGPPSAPIVRTVVQGVPVAMLARHGDGHLLNPSRVPYQANIFALKSLGVTHVLASTAVGSLRESIAPGHLVIADQLIDKTVDRPRTFFDDLAVHVEFAAPFCSSMRAQLLAGAKSASTTVHSKGTYVCMEGPQFSTRAECELHRSWGADLIGMTALPEAKLAREAELCYALVALPTDYDCWKPHPAEVDKQALLQEIIGNLQAATRHAVELIRAALPLIAAQALRPCACQSALELAIWSDRKRISPDVRNRLGPLLAKYFPRVPSGSTV